MFSSQRLYLKHLQTHTFFYKQGNESIQWTDYTGSIAPSRSNYANKVKIICTCWGCILKVKNVKRFAFILKVIIMFMFMLLINLSLYVYLHTYICFNTLCYILYRLQCLIYLQWVAYIYHLIAHYRFTANNNNNNNNNNNKIFIEH